MTEASGIGYHPEMTRLQPFGERLWIADGSTVSFYGFPYPTRMAIAALAEGLWVWSPVELDPALEAEVRALGEVRWLVSPNKIHHLFLSQWLDAFDATAFAPPGLAERRAALRFAGSLGDAPEAAWESDIDQVIIHGSAVMEEVLFFHRPSSTCLVGDLIQRHDPEALGRWQRAVMKLDDLVGPHGSTPREWRATFTHRQPARQALDRALAWQPRQLVVAHGACAREGGAAVLEEGLSWIRRSWPV